MSEQFEQIKEGMLQAISHARGRPVPGTRVHSPKPVDVKALRLGIGMTQAQLSDKLPLHPESPLHCAQRRTKGPLMESAVLTLRVDAEIKAKLDKLAQSTKRSKSLLAAEAIERYLEVEAWQIKEIKQAIKEADAGDFFSDAEFAKIVKKYAG